MFAGIEDDDDGGGGWIESTDPNTGRTFYANRATRTTQWDPPPGWRRGNKEAEASGSSSSKSSSASAAAAVAAAALSSSSSSSRNYDGGEAAAANARDQEDGDDDALPPPLPDGWEEMTDPSTGRTFYVDHATRATTWVRPAPSGGERRRRGRGGEMPLPREMMPAAAMTRSSDQYGSTARWDDDPRRVGSGTAADSSAATTNLKDGHYRGDRSDRDHRENGIDENSRPTSSSSHPGPPPLDFAAVSVPDAMRSECPGCSSSFTYTRRRHHCRLCGVSFVVVRSSESPSHPRHVEPNNNMQITIHIYRGLTHWIENNLTPSSVVAVVASLHIYIFYLTKTRTSSAISVPRRGQSSPSTGRSTRVPCACATRAWST